MKDLSSKIVKHKNLILIISLILLIPTIIGIINTKINYNVLVYLPEDIETMKGQEILTNDFNMGAFSVSVLENMSAKDVISYEEKVRSIDGVEKVVTINDLIGTTIPIEILPSDVRDKVYKDNTTLLAITFKDSTSNERTLNAIEEIRNISTNAKIGGMSAMVVDTMNLSDKEVFTYVIIAVVLCIIVLMICLDSYVVPFILLANIGIAILYNMGSNIIFGDISYITKAISAVLQLGVTTDFSIFLYHRYEAEKKKKDKQSAMASAIKDTFISVAGSSLTTIAGFLALCTMTLLLGKDIGLVMAKGVLLGVICVLTIFPALLLTFDKVIERTTHKDLLPEFNHVKNFTLKHYKAILIVFILLIIPAYIGNKNVNVYYNLSDSLPKYLPFNVANTAVKDKFGIGSPTVALISNNIKNNDINNMLDELNEIEGINFAISASKLSDLNIPESWIDKDILSMIKSENYQMVLINSNYDIATNELNNQIDKINTTVKKYDSNALVAGEGPLMKDLIKISDTDFHNVNYSSIAVISIIMLFVLKSISLPIILISAIEFAILLNMATFYYTGITLPFIASIIIGTIQLGATIDYAILMTTKYLEKRKLKKDKFESMKYALDNSVKSIFTSGLCFFAATFGVGLISKIDMIGSICHLIARGAIISMIVVIFILPSLLLTFDKVIVKSTKGFKKGKDNMKKKTINIAFLALALLLPISASAQTKNETVYQIIDKEGNTTTTVSEEITGVNGDVFDESDLENILNVNGNEEYFKNDNKLTWKGNSNNIYYQGTTNKKLPININVRYFINNEEVNPKNSNGKQGHVKIVVDYTNLDKHGKYYTPFVVTFATLLENANNATITYGKTVSNGNQVMAIGIATPYLDKSLDMPSLSKLNTITLEYDTNSFKETDIYNVYSSNILSNEDLKIFDKLDSIYSKVDTLSDASTKINDGAKKLANGMNEYNTNFKEYKNGVNQLNNGTKTLNQSYKKINTGIITINSSVGALNNLVDQLEELKTGLKNASNGIDKIVDGLTSIKPYLNTIAQNNLELYNILSVDNDTSRQASLMTALNINQTKYQELLNNLYNNYLTIKGGTNPLTNEKVTGIINNIDYINSQLNTISTNLNDGANKIDIDTIKAQVNQLMGGLNTLENGSNAFDNGLDKLSSSTSQINDATTKIYTATTTINDGMQTLSTSINKFDKEGIQTIASYVNNDLKTIENKLKDLQKLGNNYDTFTKKSSKMDGNTKFIVKIEAN